MFEVFWTLLILKLEGVKVSWLTVLSPLITFAIVCVIVLLIKYFNG